MSYSQGTDNIHDDMAAVFFLQLPCLNLTLALVFPGVVVLISLGISLFLPTVNVYHLESYHKCQVFTFSREDNAGCLKPSLATTKSIFSNHRTSPSYTCTKKMLLMTYFIERINFDVICSDVS